MREIARDDEQASGYLADLEAEAPVADPRFDWIWRAWHRLSDDRPRFGGGMGPSVPGRIPWTVVKCWCDHNGLTKGEMSMLDTCFAAMDVLFIEWWTAQQKAVETAPP